MAFEYTEIFEGKSPFRAGFPVNAAAGGTFGLTSGPLAVTDGYITSNLTSCKLCIVTSSISIALSGAWVRSTSNNVIQIASDYRCSGTWLAFGI